MSMTEVSADHPYSPAFVAGGLVFISGALSVDADGVRVPGRTEALDAAIDRMVDRLATVGGKLKDVVKLTYFVTDLSLRAEANRQIERLFDAPHPDRTFVEVSGLPYGATVESDAIGTASSRA